MFYREYLRVRNYFIGFAIAIALVTALSLLPVQHPAGSPFPYSDLFGMAGFVAALFGTVLGTCLAAENCGHLEFAWTRPVSRVSYAARLMAVDVSGIFAIFGLVVVAGLVHAAIWQHHMIADATTGPALMVFMLDALAWFALIAALTASVRGRAGAIAGFSWVAAGLIAVLAEANLPWALQMLVKVLNYLNPLVYLIFSGEPSAHGVAQLSPQISTIALCTIIALSVAAALGQWRRLEA
jgi:hypothetical protein